jgi:nickel transport protein
MVGCFAALAVSFAFLSPAIAHKVTVFAWVEGDTVFTESKLSGGKRVIGGDISITDGSGNVLLTGKTDNQGAFSFKMPQKPPLTVVLDAGMGHRATWTIQPEDAAPVAVQPAVAQELPATDSPPPAVNAGPDPEQLEALLEKIIDRKLSPVIKMLADNQQQGPSITEIIGGIGYIFGLIGIVAYFKSRKNDCQPPS